MSTVPKTFLTPEQYLEIDRQAEFKSEYYRGEMFAMAGAAREHNLLVANILAQVHQQLRGRPCEVYPSDMRVRVRAAETELYTYPDVTIVCGQPQFLDGRRDTLLNPTVIVEILSPSTEAYDRGKKFAYYRSIETLREYVMVSSDRMQVERFRREAEGQWLLTVRSYPQDTISLESAGCTVRLADIYERVEFPEDVPGS